MNECLIEGCPNEAKLIAKSGDKSYYACEKHRKEAAQIVATEHSRGEKERILVSKQKFPVEEREKPPKWIVF